jgi:hypothetical protein
MDFIRLLDLFLYYKSIFHGLIIFLFIFSYQYGLWVLFGKNLGVDL